MSIIKGVVDGRVGIIIICGIVGVVRGIVGVVRGIVGVVRGIASVACGITGVACGIARKCSSVRTRFLGRLNDVKGGNWRKVFTSVVITVVKHRHVPL